MKAENKTVAAIILAAGLGTRMKSQKPKVLHEILGKAMVLYVLETAQQAGLKPLIVVVGAYSEKVCDTVTTRFDTRFAYQKKQLGTGHAVMTAIPHIPETVCQVMIMCGDVPLLRAVTLTGMLDDHIHSGRDLSVLGVDLENPTGYGRLVFDNNRNLVKIVEEADATMLEKQIQTINSGTYCVKKEFLIEAIEQIRPDNIQGELYLTDIIEIGYQGRRQMGVFIGPDPVEIKGVNTRSDLEAIERLLRERSFKTS